MHTELSSCCYFHSLFGDDNKDDDDDDDDNIKWMPMPTKVLIPKKNIKTRDAKDRKMKKTSFITDKGTRK